MPAVDTILCSATAIFFFVSFLFVLSLFLKRNDIADVVWGPGIALTSYVGYWHVGRELLLVDYLVLGFVTIWATRLGIRIYLKNRRKGEDPRYLRWRESWGKWFYLRSYFQVYLLQGALMIVLAYPLLHLATFGPLVTFTPLVVLGIKLWLLGFLCEAIADYQLDSFIKNPANKGKLMTTGLWHYSRHPNYFGEITMWWAIFLIVSSAAGGMFAIISPLTITGLIIFVSGVPLLEAMFKNHPDWPEYQRTTSMLIPWWPKK